ncbi:MAG: nucleotidyltransferase domain-containing protein [Phycisphaerae bacterium]
MLKKSLSSVKVFYPPYSRDEVIEQIRTGAKKLNVILSLQKVILFGSYAGNRHTVASDIDLLVVYRGTTRQDAYSLVRKHIPLPRLEPHVYSEEEYRRLEENIKRMVAKGVVII